LKYTLVGISGLIGLVVVITIIGVVAGVKPKPAANPTPVITTVDTGPSPEPITTPTNRPSVKPKTTPKATVKPTHKTTAKPVDKDKLFLLAMRIEYPVLNNVKDEILLNAGHGICDMYEAGYTTRDIGVIMLSKGIPADMAGYEIGAANEAFCPKYNS